MQSANLVTLVFVISAVNLSECANCGKIFTQNRFILESPLYPSKYPLNYQCQYYLRGEKCKSQFNLQFLDFDLEYSVGCAKDRFEVGDQDALCGIRNGIKSYVAPKGDLNLKFISDKESSGRGFRILVTRLPCRNMEEIPDNDVEFTTRTTHKAVPHAPQVQACCQNLYNSKQFVITSPNFPYSMSSLQDCQYAIHKANSNVCRLRIHVHFFYLGTQDRNCLGGFLQIDGKFICGCKSDLKLISAFDGDAPKTLRFISKGLERSSYTGFVLQIIQDECPKKYDQNLKKPTFKFYNDQINRVAWPTTKPEIEKLRLISENTEIIEPRNTSSELKNSPQIYKTIYVFGDGGQNEEFGPQPRDREETTYVDTSSGSTVLEEDGYGPSYCVKWNKQQYSQLATINLPSCNVNQISVATATVATVAPVAPVAPVVPQNCIVLDNVRGYFRSPGYPFYYPGNLNICYRFSKRPGYCAIRMYMNDFNIENSPNCQKDYIMFDNNYRYCSNRLANTVSTFDMNGKFHQDAIFVSDAFYCGRGFFGTYEQIACQQDPTYPINPTLPPPPPSYAPSTPSYLPPPTSSTPLVPCHRTIQDETFIFEVYDYNEPQCSFFIRKSNPDVCKVRLYFEKFDLMCAAENLVIDGTMYCGHLSGQTVTIDVSYQDPVFTYKRLNNLGAGNLRFRIRGVQISDDCPYVEVPAERIMMSVAPMQEFINSTKTKEKSKYLVKMEKNFKEICGVITNSTKTRLPESFCNFIMGTHENVTECVPLKGNSLFVPLESQKLELKIQDSVESQSVEFEEVDCDNL